MADAKPNYALERKRIELEKSQLLMNIQRSELRLFEMDDEKERLFENIEATKKAIDALDQRVEKLPV